LQLVRGVAREGGRAVTVTLSDLAFYWPRWVFTLALGLAMSLVFVVAVIAVAAFCVAGALVTSAWRNR
jgi:hypothetical protein